jgi:hypothetical protein
MYRMDGMIDVSGGWADPGALPGEMGKFRFRPVPEPASVALVAMGSCGLVLAQRRWARSGRSI